MKCPKCQYENREGAKFCNECGNKLESACPECGNLNRLGAKFCDDCGHNLAVADETPPKELSFDEKLEKIQRYLPKGITEKVLSQKDKIEGERKQVTVMFCDMKGSTPLTEKLGPEETFSLMDQIYEILIQKVHEYEGTVNELRGDGILALFGAPIALEDAPQRAIRSAYSIHREMTRFNDKIKDASKIPPILLRIGINTGPVVVGTVGNDLRVQFTAVGDTINLASRVEGLAEPGTTYVTEDTFKLTGGFFRFEALGKKEVKGKEKPVNVYRVIAPNNRRTRFDVSAERGLTPFVGRQREFELLLNGFERAKEGRGQAFSIMAEAGAGKSRFLYEFRKAVVNEDVTFLEGKCLSYSRDVVYHSVIDVLKSNFDVREGDGDSDITEKLKKGLKILGANEASTLPYLLELFSVKDNDIIKNRMSPEVKKARIIEAVKGITLRGAEIRPLVMAIEDLHWVDKSSEDYWKNLLDSISGARIFLLFTYRPDFVHTWGGRTYHNQVNLNRLSNQESLLMVSHLLRTDDLDRGLEELILEKTEGVPFFIEEFVKSLKDLKAIEREENKYLLAKDIHDLTIPSTVQDMIMARVDSLPEDAKELLQTGSVIEREFFYELIKLISGLPEKELLSRLSMLKDSELLYERGIYPESTYIFKHALTRVVVYDSLLRRRKKMLHRLIGRAIEKLNADRLAEQYEVLAKHFVQGDEWAKALEYLCKAAEKATQTFANREAVSLYDHALEAARHIADAVDVQTLMAIYKAKADLYFTLSDFENSRAEGKRLLSLAHRVGDKEQESVALATMGKASLRAHDFEKALAYSDQAIEVAGAVGAKPALAAAQYTIGVAHAVRGYSDMARERIDKSLTISRSEGDVNDHVLSLYSLGLLKNWEGEYEEALHYVSEGIQIGSKHNLSVPLLQCIWAKGLALTGKGDFDDARLSLEEGLAFSEKLGDEVWGHRILNSLGWLYRECEDLDSSLELNLRAAAGTRERGDAETIANSELNLGEIFLAKGDLKVAKDFFDRVYNIVRDPNTSEMMLWRYSNRLYANLGEFWLAREDTVKAWEFAEQALEIARRTNSKKNLAKGWRLEAEIALFNKQWDKAESALKRALTMAQAIGNPTQLWKTYLTMGRLHTEVKRLDMAFQAYQAARTIIEQIQRNLRDPGLRSSLVNSPLIKKIYDLSDLD